jgi:hypothetical protein
MKSKVFVAMVAVACLFLSACHEPAKPWRVKTEYTITKLNFNGKEFIGSETRDSFIYKPDGSSYRAGEKYNEKRIGNVVRREILDTTGKMISTSVTFLNKKDLVDSIVYKDDKLGTYINKYVYDKDGKLIENRQYPSQGPMLIMKYKLLNGNLTEEEWIHHPAFGTSYVPNEKTGKMDTIVTTYEDLIIHHEYYPDKANMPTSDDFGYLFDTSPDRVSKNLRKRSVQLSPKGDTTDVFDFHYRFDDKGRVVSKVQISKTGTEWDSTGYSYY